MNENGKTSAFDPEIVVLYCQQCVGKEARVDVAFQKAAGFSARAAVMACSSRVEVSHILKILEQGADAVEVVACPSEQCKFLVGSARAEKRIQYARHLLDEIHMGGDRVGISRRTGLSAEALLELAAGRADAARSLGPNPMKKGEIT